MDQQLSHDTLHSTPVSQTILPQKKQIEMLWRIVQNSQKWRTEFAIHARRICKSEFISRYFCLIFLIYCLICDIRFMIASVCIYVFKCKSLIIIYVSAELTLPLVTVSAVFRCQFLPAILNCLEALH